MFTGLIQDIGHIKVCEHKNGILHAEIIVQKLDLSREKIGASIACSGCCLTMTQKTKDSFQVEISQETLGKTNIGQWQEGMKINLESSLRLGDELGGHLVYGHVDGLASIVDIQQDGGSYRMKIRPDDENSMKFIASKGSITLDGISLTVNEVEKDYFGVNIIPHTWSHTNLSEREIGDKLHIEIDMLARYVARLKEFD